MRGRRQPPVDITLEQLFTAWLPAELARLGSAAGLADVVVRMEIEGAGGGCWDPCLRGGVLQATGPEPSHSPQLTLRLAAEDCRALLVGDEEGRLAPPSSSPTDLLFLDAASQQLLATVEGTLAFEVTGYRGRTWRLRASFGSAGGAGEPEATLRTDADTYARILARQLSAYEAYTSGKITVLGDVTRGMRVGLALLPKF